MLQLFLLILVIILYLTARHFWRNRLVYGRLIRLFADLGKAKPNYGSREKRIMACSYCGAQPEIGGELCSKCGRTV